MLVAWPGTPDDIRLIRVQGPQASQALLAGETVLSMSWDPEFLRLWSRVLKHGDEPLAIFGVTPMWPHVACGWALLSEQVLRMPVGLTRHARALIEKARSMLMLRRLEISVDTKHEAALRWAKLLGFEVEGVARCYGLKGEDNWRLARIWP